MFGASILYHYKDENFLKGELCVQITLRPGVELTLNTTQQFKTTRVMISFLKQIESKQELALRSLLANVLETSSKLYPTQKAVAQKLSELYGASFGTTSNRHGNVHALNVVFNCINERYLNEPQNLLEQAFLFLKEIIFEPLIDAGAFDLKTFTRQKNNLQDYLASMADNKQTLAALMVQELYFTKDYQQVSSFGTVEDVQKITAQQLYEYYLECLKNDQIQIVVLGALDDITEVLSLAKLLPFAARDIKQLLPFYSQTLLQEPKVKTQIQELSQSKLDLMFNLPVSYRSSKHYAALVFNGLFGASPLSKLFVNVREKESLAYYASSSLDVLRQTLLVQTGIQAENKEHVIALILEQLAAIQAQDFSLEVLENIKAGLINSYLSQLDNPSNLVNRVINDYLTNSQLEPQQWCENLMAITPQDVAQIAKEANLQAIYFLEGRG